MADMLPLGDTHPSDSNPDQLTVFDAARELSLRDGCTCGTPALRNDDGTQWHFQACRYADTRSRP